MSLATQPGTARFVGAKRLIASLIASETAGRCLGFVYGTQIPFHGMRIDVGEDVPPRNRAMLFWGLYESAEYRFIRDHLSPDLPVLECGSGIGAISSAIARVLTPGQQLVCVEGNPRLLPFLLNNVHRHGGHLLVQVIESAIGSVDGCAEFLISSDNLCSRRSSEAQGGSVAEVSCTRVSTILSRQSWPSGWQLVADIEGGEAAILKRDSDCLSQCMRIIIELHDTTFEGETVGIDHMQDLIMGLGFHGRARHGNVFVFER